MRSHATQRLQRVHRFRFRLGGDQFLGRLLELHHGLDGAVQSTAGLIGLILLMLVLMLLLCITVRVTVRMQRVVDDAR